jgi:hypothetical protein
MWRNNGLLALVVCSLAVSSAACAAGSDAATGDSGGGTGGSAAVTTTATTGSAAGAGGAGGEADIGTGGGGTGDGCADDTKLVYLLGKSKELYRFDPAALALSQVGVLSCPAGAATPFSMSVDRSGVAWVLYNDGQLFHVDTKTAACTATDYVPNQLGHKTFGMGFAANGPGSLQESLFVATEDGVGEIDTQTLTLSAHGSFGFSAAAELTGTGDGQLYGFFFGFPPYIAELDKANSNFLTQTDLDTIDVGSGFAFAFWGGDFWVFTAENSSSSKIDRYQPSSGATTTVKTNLGFKVVGAGVSTCAPVAPPS